MKTQTIVEGLLYVSGNNPLLRKSLQLVHILNDSDRNWESKPHIELYFLDAFKKPKILTIIDKQIHTYIIGDIAKGRTYNILNVEGFTTNLLVISKGDLNKRISTYARESMKLFLPESFVQRIIFISPDYENKLLTDNNVFIFNKLEPGNLYKKTTWTIGPNIYDPKKKSYETRASEIIKAIEEEF